MNDRFEELRENTARQQGEFRPELLRLKAPRDRERFLALLQLPGMALDDTLEAQLVELVKSLHPSKRFTHAESLAAARAHLGGCPPEEYGVWVYYPWANRLVHLLDEEEFVLVRTDRNRNKITREEQATLATKRIGVIGLSVGQSVSLTMAAERSFGEIRLADFDSLELSNLNRIRSGVHRLGSNKAVNVAREIAQLDPFLKVTCFTDGLTRENMDAFFTKGGTLDLLVEECDSVDIKILARQKAKSLRIPVVMDMSDRGCIDVERFDLEPDRRIMHGWIDHLDLDAAARPMTNEEKVPFMLPIVGMDTLSPRLKASVIELGHTVTTWPQLASAVILGGAVVGDVARRVLLGAPIASGRTFVDIEALFPGAPTPPTPQIPEVTFDVAAIVERIEKDLPVQGKDLPDDLFIELVQAGALAPSAGNMQPWRFMAHGDAVLVVHHTPSSASVWDPDHLIAHIALGTCVENIVLQAERSGHRTEVVASPLPGVPELAAAIRVIMNGGGGSDVHELADLIGKRCTDRTLRPSEPSLLPGVKRSMEAIRAIPGCEGHLLEDRSLMQELGGICGEVEKLRVLNPIGHREFFQHELRWTTGEAERTRDGLDIATLEMRESDVVGLRIASDPATMALVDQWQAGKGFERFSQLALDAATAVVLVSVEGNEPKDRLLGGRAVERFWLAANKASLSVHPISAPIFLAHAARVGGPGIRPKEIEALHHLEERFRRVWALGDRIPLFMMRISPGGTPSARALRKPLTELILQHVKAY